MRYPWPELSRIGLTQSRAVLAQIPLGALIEAAMLIVVAEDRGAARVRSELVIVDPLEGLRR
jgi:hypothetical protein